MDYIVERINELKKLENRWYENYGIALDKKKLDFISEMLSKYYDNLPYLYIYPTPQGNIIFEWQLDTMPSLEIQLFDMSAYYNCFDRNGKDIEMKFDLSKEIGWIEVIGFLRGSLA